MLALLRALFPAALLLLPLASRLRAESLTSVERPNILWITCEDMSPNLGCYGDAYATTPNLDRLAAQSVRYTRAFATAPVCSPVRSCLITGVYATTLGTQHLRSAFPVPEFMKGFPSYLRAAGYYTTNNVKTDYNTSNEPEIVEASWDDCSAGAHWRGRADGQPFFAVFNDMTTHQSRSMVWPYMEFREKVQSRLREDLRHDPRRAPVPPYYPDTPAVRRTIARYYDCISVMDQNTGRILEELKDDGLADETIVFFFSDHGAGLPRHKRVLHDSGLHVPLLVRFPEKYRHLAPASAGATVGRLVSFVDFPPSVLCLAGLPVPEYMQGKPFLGPDVTPVARECLFGARDRVDEAYDFARAVRDEEYLYIRNYMPHLSYNQPSYYSDQGEIRQEITRLAALGELHGPQLHYAGPRRPREELYRVADDPHQIRNLADSPAEKAVLQKMRRRLRRWMAGTRDLGPLPEIEVARRRGDSTPYEWTLKSGWSPLAEVMAVADSVGGGRGVLDYQIRALRAADPAARWWAVVGLRAQGEAARKATSDLETLLEDDSELVRIEAAALLWSLGAEQPSSKVLERELRGDDPRAVLRAARALELLGERARPLGPAMREVFESVKEKSGDRAMFIRFALEAALRDLER